MQFELYVCDCHELIPQQFRSLIPVHNNFDYIYYVALMTNYC